MKKLFIALVILIILGFGAYFLFNIDSSPEDYTPDDGPAMNDNSEDTAVEDDGAMKEQEPVENIGQSTDGNAITAYHFGTGDTEVLFVGGIHSGYGPGTSLVAFNLIGELESGDIAVPENVKVTVIPVLNPDGVDVSGEISVSDLPSASVTAGRFNGNEVDLNRNFDCNWEDTGVWQSKTVKTGSSAFSEPEAQALKSYVEKQNPDAVVVYYSQAGEVVAGNCGGDISSEIKVLMNTYADASGYEAKESFDYYATNGDATNWLAKIGIPSVGVLLNSHTSAEWSQNKAGIEAVLKSYSN